MLIAFCKRKNKTTSDRKAVHYCFTIRKCDGLKLKVKELRKGGTRIESFQQTANMQRRKWKPPK